MTATQYRTVVDFIERMVSTMGLSLTVQLEETPEVVRVNLEGEGAEILLKNRGEPLKAFQHIIDTAFRAEFRDSRRVLVDCLGFRKDKDAELRQMARLLADRAKSTRTDQEIGPLNPYERRIVHLAVAEDSAVVSESIGDAFLKTVIISVRK